MIPQSPGQLVLPEIRVNWFDTATGEARVAVLPEEVLNVQADPQANVAGVNTDSQNTNLNDANAQGSQSASGDSTTSALPDTDALSESVEQPSGDSTANNQPDAMIGLASADAWLAVDRWKRIALGLLAAWLLSLLGLWFWFRRWQSMAQASPAAIDIESPSKRFRRRAGSRAALEPVKSACDKADASKIAREVLAWGGMVWPESPPTHLVDVAKRLESPALEAVFNDLDALLYGGSSNVNSVAVESIPTLLKKAVDEVKQPARRSAHHNALPSL